MNAVDLGNLRILIVDDEAGALNALADIFEDQNCAVTTAATGAEARHAIRTRSFDVALLDVRLPDAKGTDLLREIRESSDFTRCIMVTASPEAEDAINALNDGASAYVTKPIDFDVLKRTISEVVGQYRKSAQERRRLQDLDIVRQVGEAAMDLDLDRMRRGVLAAAVNGFAADGGVVLEYDEVRQSLFGAVQLDFCSRPVGEYVVSLGHGLAGRIASSRQVQHLEDVRAASFQVPDYVSHARMASILGAPILSPKGLLGVLMLGWRSPRAFTSEDRDLVGVLAQRLGLATANAKLYELEDKSKRRAEFLAGVSQELNTRIDNERDVVDLITRLATDRLGDGCAIFLLRPGSDILDAVRSYHRVPEKQATLEKHLRQNPVHVGEGIIGRVVQGTQPVRTSSAELRAAYPDRRYLEEVGIRCALAVPLTAHGETFGVMSFSITESEAQYGPEEEALAVEFAGRASVAIENSRLLREAQDKREELRSLLDLTQIVAGSLSEPQVLESVLMGTAGFMGTPCCCVATREAGHESAVINREVGMSHGTAERMVAAALQAWPDEMLESGTPFVVTDLASDGHDTVAAEARELGFASMMSVALDVDDQGEGLLVVLTREMDETLSSKRDMLKSFGAFAGLALANARSYTREQTIAERVQQWILATEFGDTAEHTLDGVEIATDYHAALVEARVGGDFYDIFPVCPGHVGIMIGDVSGKGLDAALITQAAKHTLRAYALDNSSASDVLKRTNDAVSRMLPADVFITLFYGILDVETKVFTWANAGHDAPLLCSADLTVTSLESTGRALGLMGGAEYTEVRTGLHAGDVLFLYTDGLTEARRDGDFLETSGAVSMLRAHAHLSAREVVAHVYQEARAYASGNLHDDIALMAIKVRH